MTGWTWPRRHLHPRTFKAPRRDSRRVADAVIRTEGLTKWYGRHRGIESVDLEVRRGEVFGFLGPNGAGKTTTLRILLDLIRPTSGRAEVLGLDAQRDSLAVRARTGYLPGELALDDRLTGERFLRFAAKVRGGVDWARVESLAARLRCDLAKPFGDLSRGNKQKVGLIQAFMHQPDLLVLDEPTGGLDPLVQQTFNALVQEARAAGSTVFLSSHYLAEVEQVCDRVAIIREGRIAAVERVADLKARALRRIDVRFATPVPADALAGAPGVQAVTAEGPRVTCTVAGSLDGLVKALAAHEVVDLVTHEPRLEDVFMTYYGEDARRGG